MDGTYINDGSFEEDIEGDDIKPYDERAQGENQTNQNKKNKIPFSFLMHHYLKTNGQQQSD